MEMTINATASIQILQKDNVLTTALNPVVACAFGPKPSRKIQANGLAIIRTMPPINLMQRKISAQTFTATIFFLFMLPLLY